MAAQGKIEQEVKATVLKTLATRGFDDEVVASYITATLMEVVATSNQVGASAAASVGDAKEALSAILVRTITACVCRDKPLAAAC